jgi:hypothetical protein
VKQLDLGYFAPEPRISPRQHEGRAGWDGLQARHCNFSDKLVPEL